MTAVDHAELKRLSDALLRLAIWEGAVRGGSPVAAEAMRLAAGHLATYSRRDAALLSEIEGLKAERDRLSGQYEIDTEIINNLGTQAPDSWRPDREAVAREIFPTAFLPHNDGNPVSEAARSEALTRADAILALRPQTAES